MGHHDIPKRNELARARQSGVRQLDREWRQDFDTGARFAEGFAALLDQPLGNTAFAGAAVLGALLLAAEQDRGLTAAGTVGATGLVAAGLLLRCLLHAAFGVAQCISGTLEAGVGPRPRGVACFRELAPGATEHGDSDRRQFDDAV